MIMSLSEEDVEGREERLREGKARHGNLLILQKVKLNLLRFMQ